MESFNIAKCKLFLDWLSKSQLKIITLMQLHVNQLVIVPALNKKIISMLCLLAGNNRGDRCLEIMQGSGDFQAKLSVHIFSQ